MTALRKEWTQIATMVLILANLIVLLFILFDEPKQIQGGYDDFYVKRSVELQTQKDSLLKEVRQSFDKLNQYEKTIDSLQKLKSKISYVYVSKYKEVDSSYAVGVVDKFDRIFTKSGIK